MKLPRGANVDEDEGDYLSKAILTLGRRNGQMNSNEEDASEATNLQVFAL